jgi:hypothetical protein
MKMSETKSAVPRRTARAGFEGGLAAPAFVVPVQAAESSLPLMLRSLSPSLQ